MLGVRRANASKINSVIARSLFRMLRLRLLIQQLTLLRRDQTIQSCVRQVFLLRCRLHSESILIELANTGVERTTHFLTYAAKRCLY